MIDLIINEYLSYSIDDSLQNILFVFLNSSNCYFPLTFLSWIFWSYSLRPYSIYCSSRLSCIKMALLFYSLEAIYARSFCCSCLLLANYCYLLLCCSASYSFNLRSTSSLSSSFCFNYSSFSFWCCFTNLYRSSYTS